MRKYTITVLGVARKGNRIKKCPLHKYLVSRFFYISIFAACKTFFPFPCMGKNPQTSVKEISKFSL
jgi:hypothetical protein